ncbi:asparaginase [Marinomonas sp. TI.3.20]|uniref:asparaginase n=1 Tax=Marinomonas sp. TI.3.20 TaxID=3121296 RepID=UPI00311FD1F7
MSSQVLILYTGGTIGMVQTEQGLAPASGLEARIKQAMGASLADLPSFDVIELNPLIDSANITPNNWTELVSTLATHWQDYEGFIILHGTDTMAYTTSALSFMLGACDKNVLVTGSQIPLGMNRSDATSNLQAALSLACSHPITDVSLVFDGKLMRGNRVQKVSSGRFKAFTTPNDELLGEIAIDMQLHFDRMLKKPPTADTLSMSEKALTFQEGAVAVLMLHPSQPISIYQSILNDDNCKAIVLMTYGAGNVPDKNTDFLDFLMQTSLRNKIVINLTQCMHGGVSQGAYAAGSILSERKVLSGYDMTLEAAFCKLHFLLAQGNSYNDIQEKWDTNICNEFSA